MTPPQKEEGRPHPQHHCLQLECHRSCIWHKEQIQIPSTRLLKIHACIQQKVGKVQEGEGEAVAWPVPDGQCGLSGAVLYHHLSSLIILLHGCIGSRRVHFLWQETNKS